MFGIGDHLDPIQRGEVATRGQTPPGARLARNLLFQELLIVRNESELSKPDNTDSRRKDLLRERDAMEETYRAQLDQLNKLCPWAAQIAGALSMAGTLSDVTAAHQEYYATGNHKLADGIFTTTEWQVLFRRSQQDPDPKYRAGLVVYLNAAKAGLWDPEFRNPFKPAQLAAITNGWKQGYNALADKEGLPVADLESDDPVKGEYEDLVEGKPKQEP